jgi:nitrate reductase beta subunit
MRVMANVGMVMNLDKCIGCHTCSVTCKQVWTNRSGAEYIWFNNVETKPGLGYPRRYEDQEHWKGGWELDRRGTLRLKGGGAIRRILTIFANPDLPSLDDYYEPWTYDYETLFSAPLSEHDPVASPRSQLTGRPIRPTWGTNWEDDLAGAPETAAGDPNLRGIEEQVRFEYEQAFMFYLPRICEHCLNPSCVASCPSGAMYKREEDGIVLVDQDKCRGWRFCVSGCPYKKVYFNHKSGKAEKCTFCYPRIEAGLPTVCSETCVGRLRYVGIVLYDADRVAAAASERDPRRLREAQLGIFLDPADPAVREAARRDGIPADWIEAARRSPVYALAVHFGVALPLHPEYRTLPMVWYVPPLSPVVSAAAAGRGAEPDPDDVFHAIDELRIPIAYLANLLAAGDRGAVRDVLRRLAAMRAFMRRREVEGVSDETIPAAVGMDVPEIERLYRLLAIAKYEDRYVVPPAHRESADRLLAATDTDFGCPVDDEGRFTESAQAYRQQLVQLDPPGARRRGLSAGNPPEDGA